MVCKKSHFNDGIFSKSIFCKYFFHFKCIFSISREYNVQISCFVPQMFFHLPSSPNLSKITIQQRSNQPTFFPEQRFIRKYLRHRRLLKQFSLIALFCKYFNIRTELVLLCMIPMFKFLVFSWLTDIFLRSSSNLSEVTNTPTTLV